jgi:hypothetical protein
MDETFATLHLGEYVLPEEFRDAAAVFAEWCNTWSWEIFLAWLSVVEEWDEGFGRPAIGSDDSLRLGGPDEG